MTSDAEGADEAQTAAETRALKKRTRTFKRYDPRIKLKLIEL
jgi:hypothetical protein